MTVSSPNRTPRKQGTCPVLVTPGRAHTCAMNELVKEERKGKANRNKEKIIYHIAVP
jgi:hypothetical protein